MDLIIWALFGAVIGITGAYLMMTGFLKSALIMAVGAFGAISFGAIGRWAELFREGEALGMVMAIIGAAAFVIVYRAVWHADPDEELRARAKRALKSSSRPTEKSIR